MWGVATAVREERKSAREIGLMRNAGLNFVCRKVALKVENSQTFFTAGYAARQVIEFPIAHHDGNYFADDDTLDRLEGEGQVAFRYTTPEGEPADEGNPNGSSRNIAGIFNASKTVLGLMPHPERAADPLHGGTDGRIMFDAMARALG